MTEIKSVIVAEDQVEVWSDVEQQFVMNAPSNFYIISALGLRVFYITKDRAAAQAQANIDFDNKYTIRCVKDQKTKSKLESGGLSCSGVNSRKGFASHLRKTI